MSIFKKARYLLPSNPVSGLSPGMEWIRKIRAAKVLQTAVPEDRVPVAALSAEDRAQRIRYWKRMLLQNTVIVTVIVAFLIADIAVFKEWVAVIATLGAAFFVGSHVYYAWRMVKLLEG